MAFFAGDNLGQGAHDDLAKEIAMAGKDWAEKHWCVVPALKLCISGLLTLRAHLLHRRWVDMEVYMYRLLLEVRLVPGAVLLLVSGCASATVG